MSARDDVPAADVVRARRVELVDTEGRVRVLLGVVEAPESQDPAFGLAVLDAAGRQRVWLAINPMGPELAFDQQGNVVVHMGVADPGDEAVDEGAFLMLADRHGRSVAGWQIRRDGSVADWGDDDDLSPSPGG